MQRFWRTKIILAGGVAAAALAILVTTSTRSAREAGEDLSNSLYNFAMRSQPPATAAATKIAIIEIDREAIEKLGWPIPHRYYAELFDKLAVHGRPWVLSLLNFQHLGTADDEALLKSMESYSRVVGMGLSIVEDRVEESNDATLQLMKDKSLLAISGDVDLDLVEGLPVYLKEAPAFVTKETHFGLDERFGTSSVVYCMPLYVDDIHHAGSIVLPTAAMWAVAMWSGQSIRLDNGVTWKNPAAAGEAAPLWLSENHCLTHTATSTLTELNRRGIKTYTLFDVLRSATPPEFAGGLVVLAMHDARKIRGPAALTGDGGVTSEHLLLTRFLADLLDGISIHRPPRGEPPGLYWSYALILTLAAAFGRPRAFFAVFFASSLCLLGSMLHSLLSYQTYFVPLRSLLVGVDATVAYAMCLAAVRAADRRHEADFMQGLRLWCSKCNTLAELQIAADSALANFSVEARSAFANFNTWLHEHPDDPAALEEHLSQSQDLAELSFKAGSASAAEWTVDVSQLSTWRDSRVLHLHPVTALAEINIYQGSDYRGTVTARFAVDRGGRATALLLARAYGLELVLHWGRIEALQLKNVANMRSVLAQRELQLGNMVQSLFLPKNLQGRPGDWSYRIFFQPYGLMSGDWIQTFEPAPNAPAAKDVPTVIALGDVVGKGTSAALTTAAIAGVWSKLNIDGDPTRYLQSFLHDLDATLKDLFKGKQFTTLSLLVIHADNVSILSCGCPPWLIIRKDGKLERVNTTAHNPLGIKAPHTPFALTTLDLKPGDIIAAYTDGVMEGYPSFLRLQAALAEEGVPATDEAFAKVYDLAKNAGAPDVLKDDSSMVLLRRAG